MANIASQATISIYGSYATSVSEIPKLTDGNYNTVINYGFSGSGFKFVWSSPRQIRDVKVYRNLSINYPIVSVKVLDGSGATLNEVAKPKTNPDNFIVVPLNITASEIRVVIGSTTDGGYARITEIEINDPLMAFSINADTCRKTCNPITVNSDTCRKLTDKVIIPFIINTDTYRQTYKPVQVNSETYRKTYAEFTVNADTCRSLHDLRPFVVNVETCRSTFKPVSITVDTQRKTYKNFIVNANTKRKLAQQITPNFSSSEIGLKSITIQTGIQSLSDRFTIETVGKSFAGVNNFTGEVAGFQFAFEQATTSQSRGFGGTTYSVTGRPDMASFLFDKVLLVVGSYGYKGGRIIAATAKQLCTMIGVDASNITDFTPLGIGTYSDKLQNFTIKEKSKKAFLDKLFNWSSEFAHRQIYYTNRNGVITVNEVGKYTTVYDLDDESKYRIENVSIQQQTIRKFVDYSDSDSDASDPTKGKYVHKPVVLNIPFTGIVKFGDSSLDYMNGLLQTETTSKDITEYNYQSAGEQNIIKTKVTTSIDEKTRSTTSYTYDNIDSNGKQTENYSVATEHVVNEVREGDSWVVDTEHKVHHVPIGNGFFGQRVVEIDNEDHTTVATSISRGSSGGSASLYTLQHNSEAVEWDPGDDGINDFDGELRNNVNIAVAEFSIVNDLIGIVNWMNNKTEETISLSLIICPGAVLVDALRGAIKYEGNLYYIQSTSAKIDEKGTRQQVTGVRWY